MPERRPDHRQEDQFRPVLRQPKPDRRLHQLQGMHRDVESLSVSVLRLGQPRDLPRVDVDLRIVPANRIDHERRIPLRSLDIAQFTDGTSNTMLYSEEANGIFTAGDSQCYNWWGDSVSGDTLFSTLYPINAWKKVPPRVGRIQ